MAQRTKTRKKKPEGPEALTAVCEAVGESEDWFAALLVARQIFHARLASGTRPQPQTQPRNVRESGPSEEAASGGVGTGGAATATATQQRTVKKVGRNQPCPCGSGKKYKRCHGRAA